ncbi:MAG TPA: tRNA 2-selenouridine(34) synthase MnmH, partial [Myxococcales bacterium]|nr:tRNA 2-selenouridine(34) synthase MnmH [Myxococcales bacterium]
MTKRINIDKFLTLMRSQSPLDVRAPTEFEEGHIPNAQNLPLFTDDERAEIGTLYKQSGKESAVDRGLEIVGPKMAALAREARKLGGENPIPIYCARGGMRSNSVAWLLETVGLLPVVLDGGYKQFRQWVLKRLERSLKLRVIGGLTGSGKTLILDELGKSNEQILDLEGLANHFGSAFGAIGQPKQPTQAQFENQLAWTIDHFDSDRPVWVEDESRMVGRRCVSPTLFEQMRSAP